MTEYTRVTEVLSRYSGLDGIPPFILVNAADRGTRVHKYCELYALRMLFGEIDEDCKPYVEAFKKWFDENVEEVIETENRYYCDFYEITGQVDLIIRLKDQQLPCLVDIKTSSKSSKTWDLQTAAYKYLVKESLVYASERYVLHVKKDETFELISYSEYDKKIRIFLSALEVHRFFN